jgi:6-phospho-3-hexuloisomerase
MAAIPFSEGGGRLERPPIGANEMKTGSPTQDLEQAVDGAAPPSHRTLSNAIDLVLEENKRALGKIDHRSVEQLAEAILKASRVFVVGEGRSGLAVRMLAMRLMHLGCTVHVQGETTTPALSGGDLVIALSGSGSTGMVSMMAGTAKGIGATVVAVTTQPTSPLAAIADLVIQIEASAKQDHSREHSKQFAGSLFEQAAILLFDALFYVLSGRLKKDAQTLWRLHTNLE